MLGASVRERVSALDLTRIFGRRSSRCSRRVGGRGHPLRTRTLKYGSRLNPLHLGSDR